MLPSALTTMLAWLSLDTVPTAASPRLASRDSFWPRSGSILNTRSPLPWAVHIRDSCRQMAMDLQARSQLRRSMSSLKQITS